MKDARPVIAYEPEGVRIFDSINQAARHYGVTDSWVHKLIQTAQCTADGVGFDYWNLNLSTKR